MQVHRNRLRLSAALLVLAMGTAACGGGGDEGGGNDDAGASSEATGGSFSMYISEPENPLIPSNTSETGGRKVVGAIWTGLVGYDADTSELQYNGVAESIESEDSKTWTVTL